MKQRAFNWGIIGLGKIAHKFAQDLALLPNARLCAVAAQSLERAEVFATTYHAPFAYGSYEEIVNTPDLDVVYIATPHSGHCTATILCLNHKIAVLCEKPLALNSDEVGKMITAARENDTFLMEALWTRFLPTTEFLLTLLEKNTIGKILSVHADFGFAGKIDPKSRLFNKNLGGGSLLDIGIYPVFLSLFLLGKPTKIQATSVIGTTGVDESCAMIFKYEQSQIAMLHSSVRANTPTEAFIYGEKGYIHWHGRFHEPNKGITLHIYGESPVFYPFEWDSIGFTYEAEEVMRCLRENRKESERMSLTFSTDLMAILDEVARVSELP